jgi:hypothetical protein
MWIWMMMGPPGICLVKEMAPTLLVMFVLWQCQNQRASSFCCLRGAAHLSAWTHPVYCFRIFDGFYYRSA